MEICVIGTGYVGLVVGACFADSGNDVVCVDKIAGKIERLKRGEIPIYEPELREIVDRCVEAKRLSFTTGTADAVARSRIIFIAVGTPQDEDGSADLTHVLEVAGDIGRAMNGYKIIVDKSTVPVGTADRVRAVIQSQTSHPFDVVSNPEFMKEGDAVQDFMKPDRVVIGTDSPEVAETMKELYAPFVRTEKPILVMDIRSAEMTKYAANALLASRISFINEVSMLCEQMGADVTQVRRGIGMDARIGLQFLFPGVGYGGSCFPKDVRAMIRMGDDHEAPMAILKAVEDVNRRQRVRFVNKIFDHFGGDVRGKTIAIWGLAFKPNTDDVREAPALTIIEKLHDAGARVRAHDQKAKETARLELEKDEKKPKRAIEYCDTSYDAVEGADALVIVTEWNEFRIPDFARLKRLMRSPVIFDGRNLFDKHHMAKEGFTYYSIGR